MDQYQALRELPLVAVLYTLGIREDWKIRKGGTEMFGRCPLHEAKRNNTAFSFDASGRFNCFSCGKKGRGAIDLVMALRNISFQQAVEILKPFDLQRDYVEAGGRKPEIKQVQEPEPAATENAPFKGSYEKFYVASSWLSARGFSPETLSHFKVGQYDNPKRQSAYKGKILLPVRRYKDGELVGYLARTPEPAEGEPKYVWPKGFHKHLELFGAFQLKEKAPIRVLYVVESPFCVMAFHQKGFPAVSPFGWTLSSEQVQIIAELAKGVVLLPDRNKHEEAKQYASSLAARVWCKMPTLPDGIDDPEHMSAEQIRALA